MAFHPPTLYFGYVGISIAFSFAVGALVTRDVGPAFARAMRPWVLGAWIFLTLGITAGSYWAYYELGWGGWWFWDPVENASLMPWLAATALLHSVTVLATRDGLRAWTIMLAVVAFSMSMIGTFLVRSGILTSVHAFAVDPTRGAFILALLFLYIGGAMALYALRVGTVKEGSKFDFVSREGALVVNNLLITVDPRPRLHRHHLSAGHRGAGHAHLGRPALFQRRRRADRAGAGRGHGGRAAATLAARRSRQARRADRHSGPARAPRSCWRSSCSRRGSAGCPCSASPSRIGIGLASLAPLWGRNLRRTPLFTWGMVISHLGIAVALAGMAAESAFTKETLVAASPGQGMRVGPFAVRFDGVDPVAGQNWTAVQANLTAWRGEDGARFPLQPAAALLPLGADLADQRGGDPDPLGRPALCRRSAMPIANGRRQIRLWWKPFVTLIWLGGALVALGGLLALIGRLRRERRVRPVEARHEAA